MVSGHQVVNRNGRVRILGEYAKLQEVTKRPFPPASNKELSQIFSMLLLLLTFDFNKTT